MNQNLLLLGAFAVSAAMIAGSAILLKWWRGRDGRRSPLQNRKLDLGNVPGQQLAERAADAQQEAMLAAVIMYFSVPLMLLAWALGRVPKERLQFDTHSWLFVTGGVLLFAFALQRFVRFQKVYRNANDGLLAERVTGMQLNRLAAQGCVVLHDLPGEGFNIDHVVIAPRGVYAVETKSFRKPSRERIEANHVVAFDGSALAFPDFVEREAVSQAARQADWLAKLLRKTLNMDVPVIPAVALPGWKVEQSVDVWRSASVKVFSPLGRGADFMAKELVRNDANQRALIAQALALRYPEIGE